MYNHNKAQQSKNRVHISWDILYASIDRAIVGLDIGLTPNRQWISIARIMEYNVHNATDGNE